MDFTAQLNLHRVKLLCGIHFPSKASLCSLERKKIIHITVLKCLVLTSKLIRYPEINPMRKGEPTISEKTRLCVVNVKLAMPLPQQCASYHNVEKLNMEMCVLCGEEMEHELVVNHNGFEWEKRVRHWMDSLFSRLDDTAKERYQKFYVF